MSPNWQVAWQRSLLSTASQTLKYHPVPIKTELTCHGFQGPAYPSLSACFISSLNELSSINISSCWVHTWLSIKPNLLPKPFKVASPWTSARITHFLSPGSRPGCKHPACLAVLGSCHALMGPQISMNLLIDISIRRSKRPFSRACLSVSILVNCIQI